MSVVSERPLDATTIVTGASSRSRKGGFVWFEQGQWHSQVVVAEGSVQILALQKWQNRPINLVADSLHGLELYEEHIERLCSEFPTPCCLRHYWIGGTC